MQGIALCNREGMTCGFKSGEDLSRVEREVSMIRVNCVKYLSINN